jgi:hypothetical protein
MIPKKDESKLRAWDRALLAEFEQQYPRSKRRVRWQNPQLESLVRARGVGRKAFKALEKTLEAKGAFDMMFEKQRWVDSDGKRYVHTLVRASSTEMWPMGAQYWLRDNVVIGARLLSNQSAKRRAVGKQLLLSGLHFISSCAQLKRFEMMVRSRSVAFRRSPDNWPHIFTSVSDNLSTQRQESWSHKQDAWQMLAWHVLEALEAKQIRLSELTAKHRAFLGLIVPFLAKVSFWRCENSGSWEEIPAVKSSVRAWEHRLVVRLAELGEQRQFSFLNRAFLRYRAQLGARFKENTLQEAVAQLDRECTKAMLSDLPSESPGYESHDPRYRAADAALLYLLQLDYPEFLAKRAAKSQRWARSLEAALLREVGRLQDDRSGGIARYAGDTYQRSGFFRNLTVARLRALYGAPAGDASRNFAKRDEVVPQGRAAAWTHFVWQLASWAGTRFLATRSLRYKRLHERFFVAGLRLISGDSYTFDADASSGRTKVVAIPAWRMPEAYISDTNARGEELVFPSPHTPLNWSIAEMVYACEVRRRIHAL